MEDNMIKINGVRVHYFSKINLRELFKTNNKIHPEIYCENVIYCIHNDINGKCYIGQSVNLWSRFGNNGFSHYASYIDYCIKLNNNSYLYSSIRKYKSRNFTVYIIDEAEDRKDLNNKEIYWIKTLHTCRFDSNCHGYNMTWGGEDGSNLHTIEAIEKQRKNHGGVLACQTSKAFETQRRNHNGNLAFHTPEARIKALETKYKNYDDICFMFHTPEARSKAKETNAKQYDGDPYGQLHTNEAFNLSHKNSRKSKLFKSINNYLSELHNDNSGDVNAKIYFDWSIDYWSSDIRVHIRHVLEFITELRKDSRWTKEMENIFSEFDLNKNKYRL